MKQKVYTVTAYRWGVKENHSYVVGVYNKKQKALNAAELESQYRGGKYNCEVLEWNMNCGIEANREDENKPKTILELERHYAFK